MRCWICGDLGTTGEHMIKGSDLRSHFGTVTQAKPLYLHDAKAKNRRIGSVKAAILKSPSRICPDCNNVRTQPHDRAWERMSGWLRTRLPAIAPGTIVRANRIFPYNTAREMLNIHLYFVKLFGCQIAQTTVSIDLSPFANSVLKNKAHRNVYLKFGRAPSVGRELIAGRSDMETEKRVCDGSCAFATWLYHVGDLAVNVMFVADGEKHDGLNQIGWWHPMSGANRFVISDFR